MFKSLCTAFLLTLPAPALALSCLAPTVPGLFHDANSAPDRYIMAHGRFSGPDKYIGQDAHSETLRYQFTGQASSTSGFDRPFTANVNVALRFPQPEIAGPGGNLNLGQDTLVFLKQSGAEYTLDIGHCGGFFLYTDRQSDLTQAINCLNGQDCPSPFQ